MPLARHNVMRWWEVLLFAAAGNSVIALVIWLSGEWGSLFQVWVTAQCIGMSICLAHALWEQFLRGLGGPVLGLVLFVPLGIVAGVFTARLFGFSRPMDLVFGQWWGALRFLGLGLVFSAAVSWYFASRGRLHELDKARQAAELRELAGQKAALAAHLRLLQAQIEPHFLFNTLANLHSLIGRDDPAARSLLERLNDYLRASLAHSRTEQATLGDECRLLEAYLGIQTQRMGDRLAWEIAVPEPLRGLPFPPMLLQPLVENAVRHGLESKIGPGALRIAAHETDGRIAVAVSDDGVGLAAASAAPGVGLANVRERLAALYGAAARLDLTENTPAGLTATLWIQRAALEP